MTAHLRVRTCTLFHNATLVLSSGLCGVRRTGVVVTLTWLAFCLVATPAAAGPITATVEGCVTALPATQNDGKAIWSFAEHFQFVSFHDPKAGCDPTIAVRGVFFGGLENFDGTGGLMTWTHEDLLPSCGRVQFDAHRYLTPANDVLDPMGLTSLVFNTGVDCATLLPPGQTLLPPGQTLLPPDSPNPHRVHRPRSPTCPNRHHWC